ncbi:hypothetical protein EV126DRAFT_398444 [Verticillium dahliae]|nr:hypothetical protein EV126DRAFT_398444 [Verticillium dahliae]
MAPCGGAGADTTHSHCCNQGWACLSNGLCMAAGQDPAQLAGATLMRGACTDQTWTSPDCPRWCTNAEDLDDLNVPQPIAACQAVPGAFYCANSDDAADCDEEEEVIRFSGGAPSAVTTIGVSPTSTSDSSSATSGGASQTSTSPADAATSAAESGSGGDGGGGGGGSGGGGDSNALEIGLGVGIGVGGLGVLAALIFFFLWRRRVRKTKAAADALEANEAAAAASSPTDADGEKGTPSSAGPWSPVSGSSELPTTVSRDVQEAGADSAVFEAPVGHTTAGRAEAPEDPRRFEAPVFQGTQGRHELA